MGLIILTRFDPCSQCAINTTLCHGCKFAYVDKFGNFNLTPLSTRGTFVKLVQQTFMPSTRMLTRYPHRIHPCCSESPSRRLWNTVNTSPMLENQSFYMICHRRQQWIQCCPLCYSCCGDWRIIHDNNTSPGTGTSLTGVGTGSRTKLLMTCLYGRRY